MTEIFGVPTQALFGQLLIGLINGSFYALLSLGLAVIFGLLNIINFTHGAQYMMGAFCAWFLLNKVGLGYWWALAIAPVVVGATGMVVERLMLSRLYQLDHLYGLLLTFGLALIIQGLFRNEYGSTGLPYAIPEALQGGQNLGFMFLPNYRAWVVVASLTISSLTFGEQYRIVVDIGLSAMEVFGTLIAVFLGAGLVAGDVQRRTVFPIVAKPVSRAQYVAGRYAGLVATTTLNLAVMAVAFVAVLAFYLRGVGFLAETPVLATLGAIALQLAMIAAVAVLFSTFTTATLSAIFTLSLVVAGHLASDLVRYWAKQGAALAWTGKALYLLVPNLEALNFKEAMVYKDTIPAATLVPALAYGTLYAVGVVAVAAAVFTRRDLR